ncbi:MAG TPA: sigma-70 family RNA polymerase sigma factor [Polyangiales bacterium]|nr:sigma-70 family RNA polymerase sigma factor [Polyangiales bacterium]
MNPIDPATSAYIRRVNAIPALDRAAELQAARDYQTRRDTAAAQRVITANLRHVVPIALRYRRYAIPVGELIAEGNVAMLRALESFDPARELRFATYANYWVRADILALVLRQRSMVGGGRGHLRPKFFFRLRREHARLKVQLGDDVRVREALSSTWKLSVDELSEILDRLERPDASLDAPIASQTATIGDLLPDESRNQEELLSLRITQTRLSLAVEEATAELDPRERFILEKRLMADPESEYSLVRIGQLFGVSRERARQLESRVKEKMRGRLEALLGPLGSDAQQSAA